MDSLSQHTVGTQQVCADQVSKHPQPSLEGFSGKGEERDLQLPRLLSQTWKPPLEGMSLSRVYPLWFVLHASEGQSKPSGIQPRQEAREGCGSVRTRTWSPPRVGRESVSPRPISTHPTLRLWPLAPGGPGCSNHYLGQVLLEGLQGQDHGGSYSPVIMPGGTERGVGAAGP